LVTLAALYAGFRLWGFLGLLAAPILTAAAKSLWDARAMDNG
jgi:predicted PurR-regulated permease PerM